MEATHLGASPWREPGKKKGPNTRDQRGRGLKGAGKFRKGEVKREEQGKTRHFKKEIGEPIRLFHSRGGQSSLGKITDH